jgi:uncharacterized C2H2 Zn-finger protein
MKKFKIYDLISQYVVLRCPHCEKIFRYDYRESRFGNKVENAKCQKCEQKFPIEENQLDEDPILRTWDSKDLIMIKPNGEQEFFTKQETTEIPDLKPAED